MEDIFSYLIYAIIIISFLSSFLKKKEPAKQTNIPPKDRMDDNNNLTKNTPSNDANLAETNNESYNILEELGKVFNADFKIPETQGLQKTDPYDIYQGTSIKDKDLDLVVDKRMQCEIQDKDPIGSRKTYDEIMIERKSVSDKYKNNIDAQVEASAKEFEMVLAGPLRQRTAIIDFNRKLKNPRNLREYILFSEILGKPKALRR